VVSGRQTVAGQSRGPLLGRWAAAKSGGTEKQKRWQPEAFVSFSSPPDLLHESEAKWKEIKTVSELGSLSAG
jgi:hypothetical protein